LDQPHNTDRSDQIKPDPSSPLTPAASTPSAQATPSAADGPTSTEEADAPQSLSPLAWLLQNGIWLIPIAALILYIYKGWGFSGLVSAAVATLGLSFLVFVHELGHFLTAKWCDVQVQTFSIGFGPALPGCSFRWGETTYKIGVLPLGGYVNMVGENPEGDEDEDNPRSFKNKTVGQRMLIISAGVIMNILVGCICFVGVYRFRGVPRPTAVVYRTDAGSPAWQKGVRSGWMVSKINNSKNQPYFNDLQVQVALSGEGEVVHFVFQDRQGKEHEVDLQPRRDANDLVPVIGVGPPVQLTLWPLKGKSKHDKPFRYHSAAARAREMKLQPGDVILRATDPDEDGKLTAGPAGEPLTFAQVCQRMSRLGDKTLVLEVHQADQDPNQSPRRIEVPARGFDFGDAIVGTTDPARPDEPFNIKPLPKAKPLPKDPKEPDTCDPFAYRERMEELAGKPVVIQVKREGGYLANILVPPAYHYRFGLRMQMGAVAALRKGSPATETKLAPGDVIRKVSLRRKGSAEVEELSGIALDPVRLPYELNKRIYGEEPGPWEVRLTVWTVRGHERKDVPLEWMRWDPTWRYEEEVPINFASPMSIPELGIAYYVESRVEEVEKGSPADGTIKRGDTIEEVRIRLGGKTISEEEWSLWDSLLAKREGKEQYDTWAHFFWLLQLGDFHEYEVKVRRGEELLDEPITLQAKPDESWPLADRGLIFQKDRRLQKADTMLEALGFGVERTGSFITQIYLNLRRLLTGRISYKSLGGPIEIASQAFDIAGEEVSLFILFLGIISINLAVVNFLPIPVLDGGHMVFLIYEKLRGRPPSETVRAVATYLGLAMILSLMAFVFYLDIKRRWFGM
jgi:membrane-associated protease RseP (regulator of RpoE activity)